MARRWVLAMAAVLVPGALGYGQAQLLPCLSQGIVEELGDAGIKGTADVNNWSVTYDIDVSWACTAGTRPACLVCEQDTLSLQDPQGHWLPQKAFVTSDTGPCGKPRNATEWVATFGGLSFNRKYRVAFAYKGATPDSPCDDPKFWRASPFAFTFITIPGGNPSP